MKIGFVLDDGLDKPDGVQQYILTLGKWFETKGYEVRYIVGETKRKDIKNVYSASKNIKVRFNGNSMSVPLPSSNKKIRQILKDENFDVLHVQVPYSPFMGAKVVKNAGSNVAIVGTFHILPYGFISTVATRLLGMWLRNSLKKFDKMLAVSEPAAKFAKKTFGLSADISPNSVNVSSFKSVGKKANKNSLNTKILFLGRLVPRKGAGQLIKALEILKRDNKLSDNLIIDIAGDGPMRASLEKRVKDTGLNDYVKFHGFVTNEQKLNLLRSADIAIFPSLSGESFGIVLLEAMAAGRAAVLAGDNPGYMSVMHDVPESIVSAHKPAKMAEQLHEYINNEKNRKKLFISQQKVIEKYDTDKVGKELLKIYRGCKTDRSS